MPLKSSRDEPNADRSASLFGSIKKQIVLGEIIQRGLRPGDKLPSLNRMLPAVECSRGTLFKALTALADDGILASSERRGFFVHDLDKCGAYLQRSPVYALVIPSADYYFGAVAKAFQHRVEESGGHVVMTITGWSQRSFSAHFDHLVNTLNISGIALKSHLDPDFTSVALLNMATKKGVGVVILDSQISGFSCISVDNYGGIAAAVSRLRGLGHRKIAYFGSFPHFYQVAQQRLDGYRHAMRSAGSGDSIEMLSDPDLHTGDDAFARTTGAQVEDGMQRRLFTAIVCFNDIYALTIKRHLDRLGVRVPEELSVVGFDNASPDHVGEFAAAFPMGLASMDPNREEMGRSAAEVLLQAGSFPLVAVERRLQLKPQLVERGSLRAIGP